MWGRMGASMKNRFFIFVAGGALGFAGGALAMLLAFPFLFMNEAGNEAALAEEISSTRAAARFDEGAPGQDAAHWGKGELKIYEAAGGGYILELQKDFEVGPGPNFWIYANSKADIGDEADFNQDEGRVRLAKLKNFRGSQVYQLGGKAGEALAGARAITIWCESFGQYIASANLPAQS